MKRIILILTLALVSCSQEPDALENPFLGRWYLLNQSVKNMYFTQTDIEYDFLGVKEYWTYNYNETTIFIDKNGVVIQQGYNIVGDTLYLQNGNTVEKWHR